MSQPGEPSDHSFQTWCRDAEPELRRLAYLVTGDPGAARLRALAALVAARSINHAQRAERDDVALRQLTRQPDSAATYRVVHAGGSQATEGYPGLDQRQQIVWDLLSTMAPRLRAAVVLDVYAERGNLVEADDVTAGLEDLAAVLLLPVPAARELTAQTLIAQTLTVQAQQTQVEPTAYADVVRAAGHRRRRQWRIGALAAVAAIVIVGLGATLLPSFGLPDPGPLPEPTTVSDERPPPTFDPDNPFPPPWVAPPGSEPVPISSKITVFRVRCAKRSDSEFRSRTVVRAGCRSIPHKR